MVRGLMKTVESLHLLSHVISVAESLETEVGTSGESSEIFPVASAEVSRFREASSWSRGCIGTTPACRGEGEV